MVFSSFDKRRETAFWPLINTLEGELKDTPWWKIFRRLELIRELDGAKSAAFAAGIQMALDDLEKAGVLTKLT